MFVKEKHRPYVVRYDDIVEMRYKGKDGYYCDGSWFETYEQAWNYRAAGIMGG